MPGRYDREIAKIQNPLQGGIVLAGGGALLKGMDVFLREETSLPIIIAEDPLTCVALGAGKVLDDEQILKKVIM